jgi:hypothetical protein
LTEIINQYALEFARASKGSNDLFWSEYKRFMRERASSNSQLSYGAISNAAYCLLTKEDLRSEHGIAKYLQAQISDNLQKSPEIFKGDIDYLCIFLASLKAADLMPIELQ